MNIVSVRTPKLTPGVLNLLSVLDDALPELKDGTVLAVTSKIVSICEGSVVPLGEIDKHDLVIREAELYTPGELRDSGRHFTYLKHSLISSAGIDESNGDGYYILWPRDAQKTANDIRQYLAAKHGLKNFGVIITDSASTPLRRGAIGVALAHSGFKALYNYVGTKDLFDRTIAVSQANVSGGLAAASVLAMGEGSEQTPLCLLSEIPHIEFQDRDPNHDELAEIHLTLETDLFAPFWRAVEWRKGDAV